MSQAWNICRLGVMVFFRRLWTESYQSGHLGVKPEQYWRAGVWGIFLLAQQMQLPTVSMELARQRLQPFTLPLETGLPIYLCLTCLLWQLWSNRHTLCALFSTPFDNFETPICNRQLQKHSKRASWVEYTRDETATVLLHWLYWGEATFRRTFIEVGTGGTLRENTLAELSPQLIPAM